MNIKDSFIEAINNYKLEIFENPKPTNEFSKNKLIKICWELETKGTIDRATMRRYIQNTNVNGWSDGERKTFIDLIKE